MGTPTIDIEKTPVLLADLLTLTENGNEIIIAKNNRQLARLIPATPSRPRIGNLNPGSIFVTDDFDEPLSDNFWMGDE
jgi:antitoxin (DNA-binding transcriptional repressor) of toxin-antitoxin stability system